MTKTIILSEIEAEKAPKKPIEFIAHLTSDLQIKRAAASPSSFRTVVLICKNYTQKYDLMFAYNEKPSDNGSTLYLGKWNDGIVE